MADAMTPRISITSVSGIAYVATANGENRGASANALNITVPAAAPVEDAKRPHLRLVRE